MELTHSEKARLLGRGHASARFWSTAVSWQLERVEGHLNVLHETEARVGVPAVPVYGAAQPIHTYDALEMDAHFLLIAVRNILSALERQDEQLGRNDRLRAARRVFDARFRKAPWLRDALEHADWYAVGKGQHQAEVASDPRRAQPYFVQAANDGKTVSLDFRLGALSVPVAEVADAAIRLAKVIEEVRHESLDQD